ncbi:MAG: cation:proton antiporter [Rickettsiaceae bacterium]|nr:MAG: cation:proton antiporter [Rickettsiaceae bacterium]
MIHQIFLFLLLSIASFNLLIPFISQHGGFLRNYLLLIASMLFFLGVILLDWLFLQKISVSLYLFSIGKYQFALSVELYGLVFLNLLACLWIVALLYTSKYLELNNENENSSLFIFFMNLCVSLGVLVALSANLFTMFIAYEMLTLATIPLIIYKKSDNPVIWTALYKYLKILMTSSLVLFLPAIIIIYSKVGNGNFIAAGFVENYFGNSQSIILFLMFIFGISKAALYPLCGWLPAAMVANYPTSALLHAVVVVKVGLFCLFKICTHVFGLSYLYSIFAHHNWIVIFPAVTVIYSSVKALSVNNIKAILAYSTINGLAISLLVAFMFTKKSMSLAILHMISHSVTKICLFYCIGIFYSFRKFYNLQDISGLGRQVPIVGFIFVLASLSLIGIPPFGGFISKFLIIAEAIRQKQILIVFITGISGLLSSLYILKINTILFSNNFNDTTKICYVPLSMNVAITICAVIMTCFALVYKLINPLL